MYKKYLCQNSFIFDSRYLKNNSLINFSQCRKFCLPQPGEQQENNFFDYEKLTKELYNVGSLKQLKKIVEEKGKDYDLTQLRIALQRSAQLIKGGKTVERKKQYADFAVTINSDVINLIKIKLGEDDHDFSFALPGIAMILSKISQSHRPQNFLDLILFYMVTPEEQIAELDIPGKKQILLSCALSNSSLKFVGDEVAKQLNREYCEGKLMMSSVSGSSMVGLLWGLAICGQQKNAVELVYAIIVSVLGQAQQMALDDQLLILHSIALMDYQIDKSQLLLIQRCLEDAISNNISKISKVQQLHLIYSAGVLQLLPDEHFNLLLNSAKQYFEGLTFNQLHEVVFGLNKKGIRNFDLEMLEMLIKRAGFYMQSRMSGYGYEQKLSLVKGLFQIGGEKEKILQLGDRVTKFREEDLQGEMLNQVDVGIRF